MIVSGTLLQTGGVVSAPQLGFGVQVALEPLQVPEQVPPDWHGVLAGANRSAGQATEVPSQVSATSHAPLLPRQVNP